MPSNYTLTSLTTKEDSHKRSGYVVISKVKIEHKWKPSSTVRSIFEEGNVFFGCLRVK